MAVGERLLELGVILAKPLAETAPPVAPPPHFQKVIRRGEAEENRVQNVVQRAHASSLPHPIRRAPVCQEKFAAGASGADGWRSGGMECWSDGAMSFTSIAR